MRFLDVYGRLRFRNIESCRVRWDKFRASKPQFKVKKFLKKFWENDVVYEEMPVYGSRLRVDIVNVTRKIAVEVHGEQHENFNPFFHRTRSEYFKSFQRDEIKAQWLERNGFTLIIIYEKEADNLSIEFFQKKFGIDISV